MPPIHRPPVGDYELKLSAVCRQALKAHRAQLDAAGLTAHFRGVTDLPNHGAELTIDFEGQGGVADVLEFTITSAGQPTLDVDRLREWLANVLPTVSQV